MKVIKLKNEMIIKEVSRNTDRIANRLEVVLTSDILYGDSYLSGQVTLIRQVRLAINKQSAPELWTTLKDAGRDALIERVYQDIAKYKDALTTQATARTNYDKAVATAQKKYDAELVVWESRKKEINQKIKDNPTYVPTDKEKAVFRKPPELEAREEPRVLEPIDLLVSIGLNYLTDLIVTARAHPSLLEFDQIIEV